MSFVFFVLVRTLSPYIQKQRSVWDKKQREVDLTQDMAAGIESRNPVCHRGSGAPSGTAALGWWLQHLTGVLCPSPCLFSLLSCIHLIGKIFSWQPHLVGELWERCQPVHSSIPAEGERASYPNCLSLNLSLCLSSTGNHYLVNHLEPHKDWFTNYTPGRLSSAPKNAISRTKDSEMRTVNWTWRRR